MADEMRCDQRHAETKYSHGSRHRDGMAELAGISRRPFRWRLDGPQ
jgi:hypothetical protein